MEPPQKIVAAVSGGVDSVVMLHRLAKKDVVIAHFDHGIRPDSAADAKFVDALAKRYGLPCELARGKLGPDASEDQARKARHAFLREMAAKHKARIATAHHHDDVIETAIINILRGTGRAGMAALRETDHYSRPLLGWTRDQIYDYALKHRLEWVEDETNLSEKYLRNRVRARLVPLMKQHKVYRRFEELVDWFYQTNPILDAEITTLYKKIAEVTADHIAIPSAVLEEDERVGRELLYLALHERGAHEIDAPELVRLLSFALTAKNGASFNQFPPITIRKTAGWLTIFTS